MESVSQGKADKQTGEGRQARQGNADMHGKAGQGRHGKTGF
jgi:hypothetical protein